MAVAMALATAVAMAVVTAVATAASDTTLDTTQDTVALAVSILADRFVLICHTCFRIHNWISTIYLSIIYRSFIFYILRQREKGIGQKKAN